MSVIVHRCECGHTDMDHSHSFGICSYGYCKKKCQKPRSEVNGPLELIESFTAPDAPVLTITAPGEQFGSSLGGVYKACSCTACCELYDAQRAAS